MDITELLERVKPILQAQAQIDVLDRRIDTHKEALKSMELHKKMLLSEMDKDEELETDLHTWADALPNEVAMNKEMKTLIKALEYLNK